MMQQIRLPENILQQIIFWANSEDLGMSQMGSEELCLLIVGRKEIGVTTISLLAANILITGILTGAWEDANNNATEPEMPKEKM